MDYRRGLRVNLRRTTWLLRETTKELLGDSDEYGIRAYTDDEDSFSR